MGDSPLADPLAGVRVLDLCDGKAELTSRLLGDLGADVIRIEPPQGSRARAMEPLVDGISLYDATRNTNKRSVSLDLSRDADRDHFWRLVDSSDIVVEDSLPGLLEAAGVGPAAMRARRPALVVVSVTDFGQTGPYRDWQATEHTHLAMAGVLARSGIPGSPPLLPPGRLATVTAATSAAWSALIAYWNSLETGQGDYVDVSIYEATAQSLDPGYGIGGSATAGRTFSDAPRGRPDARHLYPLFPCADGHVRLCVLSPRQWQGLFHWLGEPAELSDPALANMRKRQAAHELIFPIVAKHFADKTRAQLVAEGSSFGVPAGALHTPSEVLAADQFAVRQAFCEIEVPPGVPAKLVNGLLELDGRRAGVRLAAPALGQHTAEVLSEVPTRPSPPPVAAGQRRPLEGLRVLDLGVIVVGAETGRLLADLGAEVVKVENRAFLDGSRANGAEAGMTVTFAWGHRNKSSLGLNLREPRGLELFKQLVRDADVVLTNFKPGTLESLGLGYDILRALNPGVVLVESSAYGPTGPWSRRMGYGPLVRAEAGVSGLWRYPEKPDSFSDASTIYPDHVGARIGAMAVLARLVARRRTGNGGHIAIAQAEVVLDQFGDLLAAESLSPGSMTAVGNELPGDAPRGVFPCAGEDEWIVVSIRGGSDWKSLAALIGCEETSEKRGWTSATGRLADRVAVDSAVASWTCERPPRQAMVELQAAGIPAGMMQRVADFPEDPQLIARRFLRPLTHPLLPEGYACEGLPALFENVPDPGTGPAPLLGQQTRELGRRLLKLSAAEIDELLKSGVLEET
ncbi:MAG: CaiB/BaiF CoA transferase family protein [Mycobacteriales bacterium]